jgi:hypothetical protein
MANDEKSTSPRAAEAASDVLRDGRTADKSKSAAGSALSQAGEGGEDKSTSQQAASAASDVMQDESTGSKSKTAAASALSQAESSDSN